MNVKRFILGSLVVGAGLAATRYLFAKTDSSEPASNSTSFNAASCDAASYDYSWFATLCGSFALAWSLLRTGLVLRTLR